MSSLPQGGRLLQRQTESVEASYEGAAVPGQVRGQGVQRPEDRLDKLEDLHARVSARFSIIIRLLQAKIQLILHDSIRSTSPPVPLDLFPFPAT